MVLVIGQIFEHVQDNRLFSRRDEKDARCRYRQKKDEEKDAPFKDRCEREEDEEDGHDGRHPERGEVILRIVDVVALPKIRETEAEFSEGQIELCE